ncbi:MAG: hypothetical protein AVDCRST_MAG19-1601 [uncultured Thermomicrobiales bacterium]|uniref:Potassium efflux system KefA protein / Small-conductance mechanosensitive channel n=1 Tax=uncultured Thermomicrobiales bacterium TaxID=1645740 RepID=A0A6J4U6U5_9BACT|nr:MAG: hypothetical protein AVDCRST_MAG19-1601 [uncultured Thermomicrobiales bacterium]
MELGAVWDETRAALTRAYGDLVGFVIGAIEAVIVAVLATFVARWLRRRLNRGLAHARVDPNLTALAANGITLGTYVIATGVVLALLGASWTALVAVLGASTVAISLALQDVLRNIVAGVYLLLERPFAIGDRIRVKDVEGRVEGIELRTTALRTVAEERVLVPNATVFGEVVVNRSVADVVRTMVTLRGPDAPLPELKVAIVGALAGLDHLDERATTVEVVSAGVDGVEVAIGVAHPYGADLTQSVVTRLRGRFPEASVGVART